MKLENMRWCWTVEPGSRLAGVTGSRCRPGWGFAAPILFSRLFGNLDLVLVAPAFRRASARIDDARLKAGATNARAALSRPTLLYVARGFFPLEQQFLPSQSPAIAAQRSICPYNAVAWHHDGCWILSAGVRPGAYRTRLTDGACDLRVRSRLAQRDRPQRLPYASLERRCHDVRRQVQPRICAVQMPNNRAHPLGMLA